MNIEKRMSDYLDQSINTNWSVIVDCTSLIPCIEAEIQKDYAKELSSLRNLVKENKEKYLPQLAQTLNDFATLKRNISIIYDFVSKDLIINSLSKVYSDAEISSVYEFKEYIKDLSKRVGGIKDTDKYYREALNIYYSLYKDAPTLFAPNLALASTNYAIFLSSSTEPYEDKLEAYFQAALKIGKDLYKNSPKVYRTLYAGSLFNYIIFLNELFNRNIDVEETKSKLDELYPQLLSYLDFLADERSAEYKPRLAYILMSYAKFKEISDCFNGKIVRKLQTDALNIYTQLEEQSPGDYTHNIEYLKERLN